jgi:hypothetical protein
LPTFKLAYSKFDQFQSATDFQTPVIFDGSFDSPGFGKAEPDNFADGLLAKSGTLFSMSAYEKPTQASMLDFHTSTALHDPSAFAAYAQPPYAPHFVFPSNPDVDHLHYVNGSEYRPPQPLEQPLVASDPRTRPEITSYTPQEGSEGSTVHVCLQTLHDLLAPPALSISLQFHSKRVDCMIQLLNDTSELVKQYIVSAQVPAFISTGHHSFSVLTKFFLSLLF